MAGPATRSYRLTMSDRGLSLFLQCHFRFCSVASDLLSYGNTLHAAVTLLAARELDELVADLAEPEPSQFLGSMQHYVGAPSIWAAWPAKSGTEFRNMAQFTRLRSAPYMSRR